ncbi:GntR family transcriptional regulator [Vagococcus intermedius]|uniref:GntR family transcriptional regulator n=1 Tax=Vagococcus intermedius TaxID=2991418 RepID=A0AAF0I604_9ENTE|nr:GntR family transcriptional regulator [Vagococcus intermedius]WEG72494.1 GntR family transcriptional regulator [Vagococcus intermedius]WEG74581.1 GntR family transcriptional regulator [Vagococcus intermedius]
MIINKNSPYPFYEQVVLGIKEDIVQGIFQPGDKLLSVREMASVLMLNPNTVSKAYKTLESEGVIVTVRGKGTFVSDKQQRHYRNEQQVGKLKEALEKIVIEASYLNVSLPELQSWLAEISEGLGGNSDGSKKSSEDN